MDEFKTTRQDRKEKALRRKLRGLERAIQREAQSNFYVDPGVGSSYNNANFSRDMYDSGPSNEPYFKPKKERPPPHLRGKEIGLWHRDRNRKMQKMKKLTKAEKMEIKLKRDSIPLELPMEKMLVIRKFLDGIGAEAPPTVSQIRMSNENSSVNVFEKYKHLEDSDFKRRFLKSITGNIEDKMSRYVSRSQSTSKGNSEMNEKLYNEFIAKSQDPAYLDMMNFREKLPSFAKRHELIDELNANQVILISGETGCGKTTQVPQFILDYEITENRGSSCSILCTQPRRISAISVAERVAQERAESLGNSVGYQIRLEKTLPRKSGSILFCTTGILLQTLQGDPILSEFSHVILDEIHERDSFSDFAVTLLKDVMKIRKDLKIILMSATLNADQFSKYYDGCPTVHIPGFTFPVKEYYLEDVLTLTGIVHDPFYKKKGNGFLKKNKEYQKYMAVLEPYVRCMREKRAYSNAILDFLMTPETEVVNLELICELLRHICYKEPPGAILVFLPGWDRISGLAKKMDESGHFPERDYLIIPLHSMMPTVSQKQIFARPPKGKRKIVIATNIAETSITIDDIVYVIDCGMIKIKNFDVQHNVTTLKEEWVSLANARQRRGRAGRVQSGVCYHMYTQPKETILEDFQLPEMLRTRLEDVILQMKVLQLGKAMPFLKKIMNPPDEEVIKLSLDLLTNMNALDEEEHLTPLGYHLAHLPVDPQPGKMILLAALFGCVDPITSIAASLSFKDAFVVPLGKESAVDKVKCTLSNGSKSDHLLMAEVMKGWREALRDGRGKSYASQNFLSYNTLTLLRDMKKQFVDHLYEMQFLEERQVESPLLNYNSDNDALLRSIICAGLYPNIAIVKRKRSGKGSKIFTAQDGRIAIHPKSVLYRTPNIEGGFLAYFLKIKTQSVLMHDCSMVFPMALIFFCSSFTVEDMGKKKLIILHNQICFSCDPMVATLIQELRAWLDWLLEFKIANPGTIDWNYASDETFILKAIVVLLTAESEMYMPDCSDQSDTEGYDQDELSQGFKYLDY